MVIRTHDGPKNPNIPLFLNIILGPDYYQVCTPVNNRGAHSFYAHRCGDILFLI